MGVAREEQCHFGDVLSDWGWDFRKLHRKWRGPAGLELFWAENV